jgi:hypothetical protein
MWHLAYTLIMLALVGVFFGWSIIYLLRSWESKPRQWVKRRHRDGSVTWALSEPRAHRIHDEHEDGY